MFSEITVDALDKLNLKFLLVLTDMKESDLDMDSTQALLDSTIPDTPDFVDSIIQDSEEDEIFFGDTSSKEKKGRNAKFNR